MSHNRTFYELFMELKIELSEFGTLNLRFKLVQRHLVTHYLQIDNKNQCGTTWVIFMTHQLDLDDMFK